MGSIPLPALHLNPPPQQANPLEQYGQLLQLRNAMQTAPLQQQAMQQENQQRQNALQDQSAATKAMQQWDGKDLNDLVPLIMKNGGSASAVIGLKQHILEQRKQYSDIAKNDADTGATNLANMKNRADMVTGQLNGVLQLPDDRLIQGVTAKTQELAQSGLLDPQHVQQVQQILQSGDPNAIRQGLGVYEKSLMSNSQLMDEAQKQAATQKDTAQAAQATAAAAKDTAEMAAGGTSAMADSKFRNIGMSQRLGRPISAEDQAWAESYKQQKTLVPTATFNLQNAGLSGTSGGQPSALAQSVASGQMKWGDVISPRTPMAVKQQFAAEVRAINPNFNSGDFTVEQKAREAFTSGNYSQQLNSINTAREHMKTFTSLADALDNGNVQALNQAGNALGMQFGSDKATNFNIAKQAFSAEVAKAFSGAGVTEGDRKEIGDKISSSSSPAQLRGAAATADALLAGKQTALQQTYKQSQSGTPNFGAQDGGSISVTAPNGKTYTFTDQASANAFKQKAGIQ